ncbi:MAG: hypothetical protein GW949_01125 [Spirochaetales bacterium]|nr:hypothetical protein [Spirochaetales bacterium]
MSLRPIDLQNLFGRLNEISKQQAAIHEASHHAQQVAGKEIAEKSAQQEERVNKAEELDEGAQKPRRVDRDDHSSGSGGSYHSAKKRTEDEDEEEKAEDPFRDPDLGNRVDIST